MTLIIKIPIQSTSCPYEERKIEVDDYSTTDAGLYLYREAFGGCAFAFFSNDRIVGWERVK